MRSISLSLNENQITTANNLSWYHALDFGDYQTIGRIPPPSSPNLTLFGVMDILSGIKVSGMKCLDVGTAHGLISLGLALKGAHVSATDVGASISPQIALASEIYDVSIDYRAPVYLEDISREFEPGSFDLIVCAGVMYHLLSPVDVFIRLRPLLKQGGLLVMESAYAHAVKEPVLVLNSETGDFTEPTTYFLPSASAIEGLARLACFDILSTRGCSPARFALLGRAVMPDEVRDRSDQCKKIHAFGISDPSFSDFKFEGMADSSIAYHGAYGYQWIDVKSYQPSFPSHPRKIIQPLGQSVSEAALKIFLGKR